MSDLFSDLEEILDAEDFVQIEHLGGFVRELHPEATEADQLAAIEEAARQFAARHDLVLVEMPWPPDITRARRISWATPLVTRFSDAGATDEGIQALIRRRLL